MKNNIFFLALLFTISLTFTSCDPDPEPPVPPELITTVNYTLTPSGGGASLTLSFQDLDGDGGNDPTITGGILSANETYSGSLELLNESISPVEDITEEIEAEDDEHQFFFQTNISNLSFAYNDQDGDGNPVGLSNTLTTVDTGAGTITIILRHQPDKAATGVSDGDIANAGGETDIEVTFPIDVQ